MLDATHSQQPTSSVGRRVPSGASARRPQAIAHGAARGVTGAMPVRTGCERVSARVALRQRRQQRLRLLEVHRVKALGEPAVDRREQLIGLDALALLLPEL